MGSGGSLHDDTDVICDIILQATFNDLILPRGEKEFFARYNHVKGPKDKAIKLDDIEELSTIGDGSFGLVFLAKHKITDQLYAVKIMKKRMIVKSKQVDHVVNEKRIQAAVSFPFLVTSVAAFKDSLNLYVVMPYVGGGELFEYIRIQRTLKEVEAQFFAAQVVLAFEYLHYLNILYRDLKPENIVIEQNGYIKIVDFGFAKYLGTSARTWTLCGTPEYMAPEIILSTGFGKGADWWSLGVLIYEMMAGSTPFYDPSVVRIYENISAGKFEIPKTFSRDTRHLVKQLLQVDLSRRYGVICNGARMIKIHPWFKNINWGGIYYQRINSPVKVALKSPKPPDNEGYSPWHCRETKCIFEEEFKNF